MPNLVIVNLTPGDNQEDLINKINQNFDSVVSAGGGPQGPDGPQGDQGPVGPIGPKGDQGVQGERGTRWFISDTNPSIGATSGSSVLVGDYWVDTSSGKEVFVYTTSGFVATGTNLQAEDIFITLPNIVGPGSVTTKNAIVQSTPFPESGTFVLSDTTLSASSANPTYSKFLISTNSTNGFPLLEFGKSDSPNIGSASDYNRHPFFSWKNPSFTDYGIKFVVPGDSLDIIAGQNLYLRSSAGNVEINGVSASIYSSRSVTLTSGTSMTFNSGSSPLLITSSNFILGASSATFNLPLTVSGSFSGNSISSISNGGTGGGIYVNLSGSSSTNRYLFNSTVNSSTSRFYVRSDGKVKFDKTNYAYSTFSGSAGASISSGSVTYFSIGPYMVTNGNRVVISFPTPGSPSSYNGIVVPTYTGASGYGGWGGEFLAIGESISINVFAADLTNGFNYIGITTNGSTIATSTTLPTECFSALITIMRSGTSTYSVFYDTVYQCGILL